MFGLKRGVMRKSIVIALVFSALLLLAAACGSNRDPSDKFIGDWVSREGSDITLHVEHYDDYAYKVVLELPPNEPIEMQGLRADDRTYKCQESQLSDKYIYFRFRDTDTLKMSFTSVVDGSWVEGWFDRKQ